MQNDMLGKIMRKLKTLPVDILGIVYDLLEKLGDKEWVTATKRFLRKENPWIKYTIDLGAPPRLPFDDAKVIKHEGKGAIEIELRFDDNLYLDGKKVILYRSERQKGNKKIVGHELCQELEDGSHVLLNSNVLSCIYDRPELFPKHWKELKNRRFLYIFFWGSIFKSLATGNMCVECLFWSDGKPSADCHWLGSKFDYRDLSASVAN